MDDFLVRYIREEQKKLCVALRFNSEKEEEYFLNEFGNQVTLIKSNREQMSSYGAVDRSAVTVNFMSTLGREAFGWGAKVLSCNFTVDDMYNFPCPGFWSIEVPDYGLFKEKLDHIMTIGY